MHFKIYQHLSNGAPIPTKVSKMKKTMENLAKAFVGESQARNRYTIYSRTAKDEGYEQISEIYLKTAENEWEHAKWLFRMINQLKGDRKDFEEIAIEADVPTSFGSTADNLRASIAGEEFENTVMYPEFAAVAESEGLPEVAARLRAIGHAENHHKTRFEMLLAALEGKALFKKGKEVEWECRKCGYLHRGKDAPDLCPSCDHPTKHFQRSCDLF